MIRRIAVGIHWTVRGGTKARYSRQHPTPQPAVPHQDPDREFQDECAPRGGTHQQRVRPDVIRHGRQEHVFEAQRGRHSCALPPLVAGELGLHGRGHRGPSRLSTPPPTPSSTPSPPPPAPHSASPSAPTASSSTSPTPRTAPSRSSATDTWRSAPTAPSALSAADAP